MEPVSRREKSSDDLLRTWRSSELTSLVYALIVLSNDQVAIGSGDGKIKIIDLEDQSKTQIREKAHATVFCLLQLPNGNLVSA